MKIGLLLHEPHRDENDLAHELLRVSERHKADHEIHHVARDLARWSQRHVHTLADIGERFGARLDPGPVDELRTAERLRNKTSELVGRKPQVALLLRDLREIYIKASGLSVDWEMLAQAAQGLKDTELLATVQSCHPDTLRQMRWANAKLKESSTQILVSRPRGTSHRYANREGAVHRPPGKRGLVGLLLHAGAGLTVPALPSVGLLEEAIPVSTAAAAAKEGGNTFAASVPRAVRNGALT